MHKGVATVAQLSGFDEIIDARTPAEFAEDHIPGAINCPVLSDAERTLLVNNAVPQNLSILKKRINELGIVEASVVRLGQDGIRIELPGGRRPRPA